MKKTLLVTFVILLGPLSLSYALETATHEVINEYIAKNTLNGFSLASYIKGNLEFQKGVEEIISDKKVWEWVSEGGKYEDAPPDSAPFIRSVNHFHNPVNNSGFSGVWHTGLFSGESALQWSQKPPETQCPGGYYSWHDVRRYFLKALTSPAKTERDENFARTFRGLGQLMHLVQDMSVPAHTRDDGHLFYNYETWAKAKDKDGNPNVDISSVTPIFYAPSSIGLPNPLAPVPFANLFDTNQYDGANPDITLRDDIGLSEYTNANFFSNDTIFKKFPYPDWSSVSEEIEVSELPDPRDPTGKAKRKYLIKDKHGAFGYRLSRAPLIVKYFDGNISEFIELKLPPVLDDLVYNDYSKYLIPRAVGYSAGLLDYFFRGDMDIRNAFIKRGDGMSIRGISFEVMNATPPSEVWQTVEPFKSGFLDLSYQYTPQGQSEPVFGLVKGVYAINGADDPINSEFVPVNIVFPSDKAIPEGATDMSFMLVFQGKLGNEAGAVAARTFDYSMHSRIAYYYQPGGFGSVSNIYTVLPDGTDTSAITTTSSATPSNSLYFYSPAWSPEGTKLAFEKESCTDPDPEYYEGE